MTPEELQSKLASMSGEEREKFQHAVGVAGATGSTDVPAWYANHFSTHPSEEGKWAHYLKLPTEEQKRTQSIAATARAAELSAEAAKKSSCHAGEAIQMAKDSESRAKWSTVAAVISAAASFASAIIALLAMFLKK